MAMLTTGPLAGYFWLEVICGVITMIIAFAPQLRKLSLVMVAAVLSIVAVFCKRVQLLVGGFQIENLGYPAVETGPALSDAGAGFASLGGTLVYFPSPLEFGVTLGVIALGVFLLLLGIRLLPLKPKVAS